MESNAIKATTKNRRAEKNQRPKVVEFVPEKNGRGKEHEPQASLEKQTTMG